MIRYIIFMLLVKQLTAYSNHVSCTDDNDTCIVALNPIGLDTVTHYVTLVSERELSSKECCTKYNRRVAPKTKCSAWTGIGQDTCGGPDAKCVPLCTRYISVDALSCGYNTSGCSMGCIDSRQVCRYVWLR